MKHSIVEKLRTFLADDIDSECKVVYALAESRKLLDTSPPDPFPFALKIYCHWALHVDLDNPKTTLPFLERVDEFVASVLGGNDMVKEHQMFREFVFLDTFRGQFKQFLKAYDLPTAVCDEAPRWHQFLRHYAGVIEDGSLSCSADSKRLKLISAVVFTRGRPTADTYVPFRFSWHIALHDGKTLTVDAGAAAPDGKEMIFHSVRLHLKAEGRAAQPGFKRLRREGERG